MESLMNDARATSQYIRFICILYRVCRASHDWRAFSLLNLNKVCYALAWRIQVVRNTHIVYLISVNVE